MQKIKKIITISFLFFLLLFSIKGIFAFSFGDELIKNITSSYLQKVSDFSIGATAQFSSWYFNTQSKLLRPINTVSQVVIGDTSTTSATTIFEVKGLTLFRGGFNATSTSTSTPTFHTNELCIANDCKTVWPTGGAAAWEYLWSGAITPTTTSAGIFVTASSTIQGSLRVDGNSTTTGTLQVVGALATGTAQPNSTTTANFGGNIYIQGIATTTGNFAVSSTTQADRPTLFVNSQTGNVGIGVANPNNSLQVVDLINFNNTNYNIALGYQAGKVSSGLDNIFIGYQTGLKNTSGENNTIIGSRSFSTNTSGQGNTGVGKYVLDNNNISYYNSAFGHSALFKNTQGNSNSGFGMQSLYYNTIGINNTAIGASAGMHIFDGSSNNATSNNSIYMGYDTRALASGDTNEIVIGASAIGIGSNTIVLGNNNILITALKGKVGIGLTNPTSTLSVLGDVDFRGNGTTTGNLIVGASSWAAPTSTFTVNGSGYFTGNFVASGNATTTGRLVIGTTQPTNNYGKIWIGGDVYNSGNSTTTGTLQVVTSLATGTARPNSTTTANFGGNVYIQGIATTTGNFAVSSTTIADRPTLFVNSQNGYVGIGTTDPDASLGIEKDSAAYNTTVYNIPTLYLTASNTNGDYTGIGFRGVSGNRESFFGVVQGSAIDESNFVFQGYDSISHTYKEFVRINKIGKVGIGLTNPTSTLSVLGDVDFRGNATTTGHVAFTGLSTDATVGLTGAICLNGNNELVKMTGSGTCVTSSKKYKENIQELKYGLGWVLKMKPSTFDFIENKQKSLGFIAEDMEKISPELVAYGEDKKPYTVRYELITAVLANAIKHIWSDIQTLWSWNENQDKRIVNLEKENQLFKIELCKDKPYSFCK